MINNTQKCEFERYLIEFIAGDLSHELHLQVEFHLSNCENCANQLENLASIHQLLYSQPASEPPAEIFQAYQQTLTKIFAPESYSIRLKKWFLAGFERFFQYQPVGVRLVRAFALVIIGIFLGRLIFAPVTQNIVISDEPEILNVTFEKAELKEMNEFFTTSEILLLSVLNNYQNGSTEIEELDLNRDIADRLLQKSELIHQKTKQLNNQALNTYLNRLEFLLIEISNMSPEEIKESFKSIRETIENSQMLPETKRIQESLQISLNQGI
ncbi:zf-HC2 domain-containing protein [candidate division KSB1 bacterium]|nr:zf-HC2 domain-containing protein [candidate division KSB1 bacterium]